MILTKIEFRGTTSEIDLERPIDISIPVGRVQSPNAFYLQKPDYRTVAAGDFVGDVNRGGSCNVEDILFSPHGNGTHTECSGHIHAEHNSVNNLLRKSFFLARLISLTPGDSQVVSEKNISEAWPSESLPIEALIIRTLPNDLDKRTNNYSGTNPPYFSGDAVRFINSKNIIHLLTDMPSIDQETDNNLAAHHIFFNHNNLPEAPKTITEMIFVPDNVEDGLYWLDLQIAGFESDASPSKPLLYKLRLI
jgi:arylformamidase